MSRLTELSLPLLVKLGSIAVFAEENLDGSSMPLGLNDELIRACLDDPDLKKWIADMGALLPKKRT